MRSINNGAQKMIVLNIGLEANDGTAVSERAALAAVLGRTRAVSCGIRQSDSEATLVLIAESLSTASAWHIAAALRQDCIAVFDTDLKRGRLIGPRADAWGAFEPAYFILPNGERLDASYAAEVDAAARGMADLSRAVARHIERNRAERGE
jgi:hypothetical protein